MGWIILLLWRLITFYNGEPNALFIYFLWNTFYNTHIISNDKITIPEPPAPPTKYLNYTRIYRKVVNKVIQRSTVISTECHIISIICYCN